MKKFLKVVVLLISILGLTYLLGPRANVEKPERTIPKLSIEINDLEEYINQQEEKFNNIKQGNRAEIIWFDSIPKKTEYAIVYLHGFSASHHEGFPTHHNIAKYFGCNLYLSRIAGHGLTNNNPLLNVSANDMMKSAAEALAIGSLIGKKVIVMSTSTGGTYSLYLANQMDNIAAHVLYSPNIDLYLKPTNLLTGPWGLQISRLAMGSKYTSWSLDKERAKYWTEKYRLEALVQLRGLIDQTMTKEVFASVTQPVFMGYYYKDEENQDNTVSVSAMLEMFDALGTPDQLKNKVAFPNTGNHVIASDITSGNYKGVESETIKFLEEVVGLERKTEFGK